MDEFPIVVHFPCGMPAHFEVYDDGECARIRWVCPIHGPLKENELATS